MVCDRTLKFLDVDTGYPGSVHDSRVFRNSSLKRHLESQEGKLPAEYHLLGDSAYPLSDYLLTPFKDNGHLSELQKKYNYVHSSSRVCVENAIGLLKGKFRRLKYLDMLKVTEIPYVIFACCVLHNFIILNGGVDESDIEAGEEDEEVNSLHGQSETSQSAEDKRMNIAMIL